MGLSVGVPVQVLTWPPDTFGPEATSAESLADQLVLRWLDYQPFAGWSLSALTRIDVARLPEADRPVFHRLMVRAEAFHPAGAVRPDRHTRRDPRHRTHPDRDRPRDDP